MPLTAVDLTTISYRKRKLVMYPVQKQELRTLAAGYNSIHLAMFGISFGVFATLLITLFTVPVPPLIFVVFVSGTFIFGSGAIYCGVRARQDINRSEEMLETIEGETVDVVVKAESIIEE